MPTSSENELFILSKLQAPPKKKKPARSYEPYFKAIHAEYFRDNVLACVSRNETVHLQVSKTQTLSTIACILSQARRYLFTHLDPDGKWQKVWDNTNTSRIAVGKEQGYTFKPILKLSEVLSIVKPVDFYSDLNIYLDTLGDIPEGQAVFEKKGLFMSEEDEMKLLSILESYKDMLTFFINRTEIHVINIPPDTQG